MIEALGGLLDAAVASGFEPLCLCPAAVGVSFNVVDDVVLAPAAPEASIAAPAMVTSDAAQTAVDGIVCADDAAAPVSTATALAVEVAASPATGACGDSVASMAASLAAVGASDAAAQPAFAAALAFVGERRLRVVVCDTASAVASIPSEFRACRE